jgi:beta-xylosidase
VNWRPIGSALELLPPEYGNTYWAPEVAHAGGKFWIYYSVGREDKAHHIRVAVSSRPEGPYRDTGNLITSPFTCPFAIDASPFQDEDGEWYLFYARDFLDAAGGVRAGTGLVMDRLLDMSRLAGEERIVVRARHDWQRFLCDRIIYGARYDWHTIEGPCVVRREGQYWCLFSAGRWENETYGVDWAVADRIEGPWEYGGGREGARLLRTIPGETLGPGHNCIATGPDGGDYIVYHAWDAAMTARRMFIDPLVWTAEGPRCGGSARPKRTSP